MRYNKSNPLRVFTSFSGYDSQVLGLQRLQRNFPDFAFSVVGWSEIDKTAIKAHDILFPELRDKNYGDICQIDWSQVPYFDLFTWSFPCTDLSAAGKQAGMSEGSNTRSSLCWEALRGIKEKKPRYALMENVPAIHTKKFMPQFLKLQTELESYGYVNFWQDLNSKDFLCPQNRNRTFMVSILRNGDEMPHYEFPKPMPLTKRLRDVLEPVVDESFYLRQEQVDKIIAHCDRKVAEGCGFKTNFQGKDGISGTIKTKEGSREYDTYIKATD